MGTEIGFMQLAGAGMQGISAISGSAANKAAYKTQAQVSRNNAQVAEWQAEDALVRGQKSVSRQRIQTAQLKGKQRASLAANGVDLGVGSALNILSDTDYFGEIDAATLTDNSAKEAWALRAQAANYRSDSSMLQSRSDRESPALAGMTSLLTSAGRVSDRWYTPGSSGVDSMAKWRRSGSGGD
jgi:hypothetical protein